mmetsp:Transcript_3071/g.11003  ORF Transcript_3071/g.11003 Transcript_3071/m.11003 type:complete len:205 (+) Transcript_3071:573-1187(+)
MRMRTRTRSTASRFRGRSASTRPRSLTRTRRTGSSLRTRRATAMPTRCKASPCTSSWASAWLPSSARPFSRTAARAVLLQRLWRASRACVRVRPCQARRRRHPRPSPCSTTTLPATLTLTPSLPTTPLPCTIPSRFRHRLSERVHRRHHPPHMLIFFIVTDFHHVRRLVALTRLASFDLSGGRDFPRPLSMPIIFTTLSLPSVC